MSIIHTSLDIECCLLSFGSLHLALNTNHYSLSHGSGNASFDEHYIANINFRPIGRVEDPPAYLICLFVMLYRVQILGGRRSEYFDISYLINVKLFFFALIASKRVSTSGRPIRILIEIMKLREVQE